MKVGVGCWGTQPPPVTWIFPHCHNLLFLKKINKIVSLKEDTDVARMYTWQCFTNFIWFFAHVAKNPLVF
jgi:hypothetical protein